MDYLEMGDLLLEGGTQAFGKIHSKINGFKLKYALYRRL
jgi:hypothetical protein